jgi:hypothetical protein
MRPIQRSTNMLPHGAEVLNPLDTEIEEWCGLVRAEYLEVPGLRLTKPECERLWDFDPFTSEAVLSNLVASGFLCRTGRRTPSGRCR